MAITNALSDAIFYLNSKNFFNNIKSVIDMGDQDFKIPLDNYLLNSKIYQIKKDILILKYLKKKII